MTGGGEVVDQQVRLSVHLVDLFVNVAPAHYGRTPPPR